MVHLDVYPATPFATQNIVIISLLQGDQNSEQDERNHTALSYSRDPNYLLSKRAFFQVFPYAQNDHDSWEEYVSDGSLGFSLSAKYTMVDLVNST